MNRAAQRTGVERRSSTTRGGRSINLAIAEWAERTPAIARVWLFGSHANRRARDIQLDIALELQPVADSEETMTLWMSHGDQWRAELEARVGRPVELDWLDPDGATRSARASAGKVRTLVYQRSG